MRKRPIVKVVATTLPLIACVAPISKRKSRSSEGTASGEVGMTQAEFCLFVFAMPG